MLLTYRTFLKDTIIPQLGIFIIEKLNQCCQSRTSVLTSRGSVLCFHERCIKTQKHLSD